MSHCRKEEKQKMNESQDIEVLITGTETKIVTLASLPRVPVEIQACYGDVEVVDGNVSTVVSCGQRQIFY